MVQKKLRVLVVQEIHLTVRHVGLLLSAFDNALEIYHSAQPEHESNARAVALVLNKTKTNVTGAISKELIPGRALLLNFLVIRRINIEDIQSHTSMPQKCQQSKVTPSTRRQQVANPEVTEYTEGSTCSTRRNSWVLVLCTGQADACGLRVRVGASVGPVAKIGPVDPPSPPRRAAIDRQPLAQTSQTILHPIRIVNANRMVYIWYIFVR